MPGTNVNVSTDPPLSLGANRVREGRDCHRRAEHGLTGFQGRYWHCSNWCRLDG